MAFSADGGHPDSSDLARTCVAGSVKVGSGCGRSGFSCDLSCEDSIDLGSMQVTLSRDGEQLRGLEMR